MTAAKHSQGRRNYPHDLGMFGWSNALLKIMPRYRALSRNGSELIVMSNQHVGPQYNTPQKLKLTA